MAVSLSPFAGAGWQFFDNNGVILSGGKLYVYAAGTTSLATTYTSSTGSTANTNPIILNSSGRLANEIWLTTGLNYKFILKTSADVLIGTWDNIPAGTTDVADLQAALASSTGAGMIGYTQGSTNAVATTVQAKLRETVSVKDFGAVGIANGGLDDTTAIQNAIDYAASIGAGIVLNDAYRVNYLTIKTGLNFFTSGKLVKTGTDSSLGFIVVNSDVRYCEISDIEMDLNATSNKGIYCDGAENCTFNNNRIYNFPPYTPPIAPQGIRLAQNSRYNHVSNNYIVLPIDSPYGTYPAAIGIYVTSNALPYGNFENGSFIQPTNLAEKNKIYGNTILNGTHAISLYGGTANEIYDNYIDGPTHRGIHLTPVASKNYIHGNKIYNFGSSAIITSYGSNSNIIIGNYCYAPSSFGEGGIQCYVGVTGSFISSNYIYCGSNYGVYIAVNANNCVVSDNYIIATSNLKAAIAVESDWVSPLPVGATYSRPNYGAPPSPRTNWASEATAYITIKNNTVQAPSTSIAGIYVSQIGSVADCVGVRSENNTITTTVPQYHIYYFQDSLGKVLSQQVLSDLRTSDQTDSKIYLATDRSKFSICSNNIIVNDGIVNIAAGTTTPNVSVGYLFQHTDTSATSVTNYLGGAQGQEIEIRLTANTTIVYNASYIRLKGSVNVVGTSTNQFLCLRNSGGIWIELWRNF